MHTNVSERQANSKNLRWEDNSLLRLKDLFLPISWLPIVNWSKVFGGGAIRSLKRHLLHFLYANGRSKMLFEGSI